MPVRVPINGSTLAWARNVLGIDQEALAKAAGVKPERLAAFENGEAQPTYNQATALAKRLDRPLAFLFVPPPNESDVPATLDFRGRLLGDLPEQLNREIRRAEDHRNALLDLESLERAPELEHVTKVNAEARAAEFRETLGLNPTFVPPAGNSSQIFNFWRGLLESHGYLIFQTTGIDLEVFKGLSIEHDRLPIIIVNGGDANNSKIFTLFHEVAHIANRTSGVCLLDDDVREEALANKFAANCLMPREQVERLVTSNLGALTEPELVAAHFKVSLLASAIRLRTLDRLSERELAKIRSETADAWQEFRKAQKHSKGFPPPWRLRWRDLGGNYVGTIARAVDSRRIGLIDATYLLDARLPTVDRLFAEYYRTGGSDSDGSSEVGGDWAPSFGNDWNGGRE